MLRLSSPTHWLISERFLSEARWAVATKYFLREYISSTMCFVGLKISYSMLLGHLSASIKQH